jgi:uncharacterized membrane protein YkoI
MHHRTMKLLARLLCVASLGLSAATWAAVSRDDAAAMAERASGGRVLSVERADSGGRPAWRVKVVTGRGEVRVILIDADSGQPR